VAPLVPHGLMLAVDALVQEPGAIVEDTDLEDDVEIPDGVVALKLLVIWRDDDERDRRLDTARRFVDLAEEHGLLSVLEGVVRAPRGRETRFDREGAIVEAAHELASVGPSLYKAEVPLHGRGEPEEIQRRATEIDEAVACPWVVLSQGVDPADFPSAVEAACRGGASGMLAGRAVWTSVLGADEPTELLREQSVPRLRELAAIVDGFGRPWQDKVRRAA
jgi:sulfofructosephosphate aldolase